MSAAAPADTPGDGEVPPTQEEIDAAYAWADRIIARIEEGERDDEQRYPDRPAAQPPKDS